MKLKLDVKRFRNITYVIVGSCLPNSAFAVVPTVAQPLPVAPQKSAPSSSSISDDLLKVRDPFRMPDAESGHGFSKSELELYPVDSFKLVGILTGLDHLRALVQSPTKKSYFVAEQMKIGLQGGFIRKIFNDGLLVRERIPNLLGQVENVDTELKIASPDSDSGGAIINNLNAISPANITVEAGNSGTSVGGLEGDKAVSAAAPVTPQPIDVQDAEKFLNIINPKKVTNSP
jgi:Tfp pilus assembly protein PilP